MTAAVRPPFPYPGNKHAIAPAIWQTLGDVPNYVEACAGTAAVHLARPHRGKVVTLNELDGFITNFYRAVQKDADAVAHWANWPVNEIDMHARNRFLIERGPVLEETLRADPAYSDPQIAGWWVWGQSIWIAAGWCDPVAHAGKKRPALGGNGYPKPGNGIFRPRLPHLIGPNNIAKVGQIPHLHGCDGSGVGYGRGIFASGRREDLVAYMREIAAKLDPGRVRITCGDAFRVLTPAVTTSHGLTGVLLDPPYGAKAKRAKKLYAKESATLADALRAWCLENGANPLLRIVMCGYAGEHEELEAHGWNVIAWKARGGYSNQDGENANAERERLWTSPHCLGGTRSSGPLFAHAAAASVRELRR